MNDRFTVAIDSDILDLAESFLDNRRAQILGWRAAVESGDQQVLGRLGHELKGTAGAFGFHKLSELGAELEKMLVSGDAAATGERVEQMIDYLEHVVIEPR